MKRTMQLFLLAMTLTTWSWAQSDKLISKDGSINFFSHTVAEDISSDNYSVTSTLDQASGAVVFSVAMQGFEFEKALMQKHFNSPKFLDSKKYPKGKFTGSIKNLSDIDFSKDGTYHAKVEGDLTLHGVTNTISENGTITIAGSKVQIDTKFDILLANYEVAFENGKPSTNVAKVVSVTVKSVFNN